MEALARIIGWKLALHGVPVSGEVTVISAGGETNRHPAGTAITFQRISGHRDGDRTSCPGSTLYAQLEDLRSRAARYATPTSGLITRTSNRRVRAHRTIDVSGRLSFADGSSPGGVPLSIEFQAAGSAWTQVASAGCAPDGGFVTTVTPPTSGTFRAVFAGDATRGRVESRPVRVDVIPRMTLALGRSRMRAGKRVTVAGTVDPAQLVQLVLERRSGRRWITERSRTIPVTDGAYGVRLRVRRRGVHRITVISGTTKRRRRLRVR
jgi:hypothetical protein